MKPSSGERAPEASMSRSDNSRGVSSTVSSDSRSSGRSPVRSTSSPPCGAIRLASVTTLTGRPWPMSRGGGSRENREVPPVLRRRGPAGTLRVLGSHERAEGERRSRCDLVPHEPELRELREHELRALLGVVRVCVDAKLRVRRLLVGIRDARELRDLTAECLLVQPLHVTARALR